MEKNLAEEVLHENIKVHALENRNYLRRHPEQTNFFQNTHLTEIINKTVNMLPDKSGKVLDLGCGTGYLLMEFLERGFEVTGVDLSPELLAALEEKIPSHLKAKTNLINSDAIDYLQHNKETFSLVSMSAFLHHLFDYEPLLKSACSALQPGGTLLIFFEPLKQQINDPFSFFLHKLLKVVDENIYRGSMFLQGISIPEKKYAVSDYQRRFGGIDMDDVRRVLNSESLKVSNEYKYCARRYGIPSFIGTKIIGSENSFDIIAVKQ